MGGRGAPARLPFPRLVRHWQGRSFITEKKQHINVYIRVAFLLADFSTDAFWGKGLLFKQWRLNGVM